MAARLLNLTQLSILRTIGWETYAPFILAPAAQTYILDCYIPTDMRIEQVSAVLTAGTCTGALQRIRAGVTVGITGLTAMAFSNVQAQFTPTTPTDGTQQLTAGDTLQLVLSAIAGGAANLAVSVAVQRNG